VDAGGVPLAVVLTKANRNDITQLLALVDGVPPIRGKPGAARRRPTIVYADRAYDSQPHREELRRRGIASRLARKHTGHGSGLGRFRWVVERTFAWLHRFRRLLVRYERSATIHEAFLRLACVLICHRRLRRQF
jgi:transposase